MKSISLDNPLMLLVAIPILLAIAISFVIAFRKDNRSKSSISSLALHIVIVALVALGLAGMLVTTVVSQTEVYIVADVSYSSEKNLDLIDEYIAGAKDKLPDNSRVGVICFGKNAEVLFTPGSEIKSVRESGVDRSGTDIASALDFAAELFSERTVKRIVLITDGKQTDANGSAALINSVEMLHSKDIYIDAVYVDSNITADDREFQVTGVDLTKSTYLNHESFARVIMQSSYKAEAVVTVLKDGAEVERRALLLDEGFNFFDFELDTAEEGNFGYEIVLEKTSDAGDVCSENNSYSFTHSVSGGLNVLLITSNKKDLDALTSLLGDEATIDAYIKSDKKKNYENVPHTVEDICKYDEIIISDTDVRDLGNFTAFIDAVDKAVSQFGKSLMTMGDTKIQNKTDDVLKQLEDMLPVKYGKGDDEAKLIGFIVDTSRSMQLDSKLLIAKEAMRQLVPLLSPDDQLVIIYFSGDATIAQTAIKVSEIDIEKNINQIDPAQGTLIGSGLRVALDHMKNLPHFSKQVILMSDGLSFSGEKDNPASVAADLLNNGITVSALTTNSEDGTGTMRNIATAGGGSFYHVRDEEKVKDLVLSDMADEIFASIVEERTEVNVEISDDPSLEGVEYLPPIEGYVNARAKTSANTVLSLDYKMGSGRVIKAPLYAWWDYGNGRVSSFSSKLSDPWTQTFFMGDGEEFMKNTLSAAIPKEKISYPYSLNIRYNGATSAVEMIPASIERDGVATLVVTMPDGQSVELVLAFDGSRYIGDIPTLQKGKYKIEAAYSYYGVSYGAEIYFDVCYEPEYDMFSGSDPALLHDVLSGRGTVSENGIPELVNDESDMETYEQSLTPYFMIAAAVLYVVDIIIRKLKWRDIVSFFGFGRAGKGGAK